MPRDLSNPSLNLPATIDREETIQRGDIVYSVVGTDLDLSVSGQHLTIAVRSLLLTVWSSASYI